MNDKEKLDELCNQFRKKLASEYKAESKETIVYKKGRTLLVVKNRKEN